MESEVSRPDALEGVAALLLLPDILSHSGPREFFLTFHQTSTDLLSNRVPLALALPIPARRVGKTSNWLKGGLGSENLAALQLKSTGVSG